MSRCGRNALAVELTLHKRNGKKKKTNVLLKSVSEIRYAFTGADVRRQLHNIMGMIYMVTSPMVYSNRHHLSARGAEEVGPYVTGEILSSSAK